MHKINQGSGITHQLLVRTLLTVMVGILVLAQPYTVVQASHLPAEPEFSLAPDNVGFEYFNAAFIAPTVVRVSWRSILESDISDFVLYRSDTLDGAKVLVTLSPIPAIGFGGGATYEYDDTTVASDHMYFYWLYAHMAPDNTLLRIDLPPAIAANHRILLPMTFKK
jgi:hypothetical protein